MAFCRLSFVWKTVVLLLITVDTKGELLTLKARFEGVGCAACVESLPERLKRIRGVEHVDLDSAGGSVQLRFTRGNRSRVTAVRDQIQQDGTKVIEFEVEAIGEVLKEAGAWMFRVEPQSFALRSETELKPGMRRIFGKIRRPADDLLVLEVTSR